MRPLILLSNDDGIGAPGLAALAEAMGELGDVIVVAPNRERSASGHAITLDRPLRVDEIKPGWFSVDGTPVDCVYIGVLHLAPRPLALCVSGINDGCNLGSDVFYSGTVAAAVEAALRRVPAVAVSRERGRGHDFTDAARFAASIGREVIARGPDAMPEPTVLNVNVPAGPLSGYRVTSLGRRVYRDQVDVRADLRGRSYYWIGGPEQKATDLPGSDQSALGAGLASVTPLGLDLTHGHMLRELAAWNVESFVHDAVEHARRAP